MSKKDNGYLVCYETPVPKTGEARGRAGRTTKKVFCENVNTARELSTAMGFVHDPSGVKDAVVWFGRKMGQTQGSTCPIYSASIEEILIQREESEEEEEPESLQVPSLHAPTNGAANAQLS